MGTHPTSPSSLPSAEKLSEYLHANPHLIGDKVATRFPEAKQGSLPFLLKILSIAKALSIQTHPDKKTAEHLHRTQPKIYKGPSALPEQMCMT